MKKILATVLLISTISSSQAIIIYGDSPCDFWRDPSSFCTIFITSSLPTFTVEAMSDIEKESFIKAEATNYLDGIEGEYVILRVAAERMKLTMDEAALSIVNK
jgi:hypothetical protein